MPLTSSVLQSLISNTYHSCHHCVHPHKVCVAVQNLALAAKVKAVADKKGCTAGQLALAWVQHQGDDVVPIPGTKRAKYLEQNVAAAAIRLSPAELQELEEAVPLSQVCLQETCASGQVASNCLCSNDACVCL